MKLRIGIYSQPLIDQVAGIAQYTRRLIEALERYGTHTYTLIATEPVSSSLETVLIPPSRISYLNPGRYIGWNRSTIPSDQFDLLIDPSHIGTLGLINDIPRIMILHDLTPISHPEYHPLRSVVGHRLFLKRVLASSDWIFTVSEQTRQEMTSRFPFTIDRSSHLMGGLMHAPAFDSIPESRALSRPYFICPGTIEPRKNHVTLLKAFDRFAEINSHIDLVITGADGWGVDLKQLLSTTKHANRVHVLGFLPRNELNSWITAAKALVYPSHFEGLGLPILEAFQLNCPVITSSGHATKEVSEGAALLVDPIDENALAQAMENALEAGTRRELIDAGTNRMNAYTWKDCIAEIEKKLSAHDSVKQG